MGIAGRYYSSLWNGFQNRLSDTGQGISNFISDPLGSVTAAAENHWNNITNPIGLFQTIDEGLAEMSYPHQLIKMNTQAIFSDDYATSMGEQAGVQIADKTVEAAGIMAGSVLGKGLSSLRFATGGSKQWLRLGSSYSIEGSFHTYGLRWGASPRYLNRIGSSKLRDLNIKLRSYKVKIDNWRFKDSGHFHWWKE